MKRYIIYILILAVIIAFPLIMRPKGESHPKDGLQLVVITPHNEGIRYEMEMAFREYYRKKTGQEVTIDWRTIGGTTEIVRYIRGSYIGNFAAQWRQEHPGSSWDDALAAGVFSAKTGKESPAYEARQSFLKSDCSIGIDLFYGGGQYDFNDLSKAGIIVKAGVQQRHPEWFEGSKPLFQQGGGGEIWYDAEDRYYATCFSTFGIICNRDRLSQAGFSVEEINAFGRTWRHLSDQRLWGTVGIADPSQSGSITKCFEMLIQYEMQQTLREAIAAKRHPTADELDKAWRDAMTAIKLIGGNAAYLTFSASKVPGDAASGQISAGMCIDTYGRSQCAWSEQQTGRRYLSYKTPEGASTVSADPIGILRGAPHRQLAEEFVDFVLSHDAQLLYGLKKGTSGGPRKYALYRLPARRSCYAPEFTKDSNSTENPFDLSNGFTYHGEWTGRLFSLMRNLVKIMIIDCGPELRECVKGIHQRGGIQELTEEERRSFEALPFEFHEAATALSKIDTPEKQAVLLREWIEFFRGHYTLNP